MIFGFITCIIICHFIFNKNKPKNDNDEPFIKVNDSEYYNDDRYNYCMCPKCHSKNTNIKYLNDVHYRAISEIYTYRNCGYRYVKSMF